MKRQHLCNLFLDTTVLSKAQSRCQHQQLKCSAAVPCIRYSALDGADRDAMHGLREDQKQRLPLTAQEDLQILIEQTIRPCFNESLKKFF